MTKIRISAEAYKALAYSKFRLPDTTLVGARQAEDSTWVIELSPHVFAALRAKQLGGESLSDTIIRVVAINEGGLQ